MDKVQSYWNSQPCNINHSSIKDFNKEYFDEVEKKKYLVEFHIPKFAQFQKWRNKKMLEIGCGIGTDATNFARNGADYHGIELSDRSLEITKKRFNVFGLEGKFANINAEDSIEMSKFREFDLVYSFGVIHHSETPSKIIKNVYDILKPGGTFKLMLYATNSWKKFKIDGGLDQYEAQKGCPIAYTYTKNEVRTLLKDFEIISIEQEHIFPYKIEEYKKNMYVKEDYFEAMSPELFNILEKNLGWHLCITCKKNTIYNE